MKPTIATEELGPAQSAAAAIIDTALQIQVMCLDRESVVV
jgi:hypothetical protein